MSAARPIAAAPAGACRNCGAAVEGRYCSDCGQATALHPPTVREFVHEFITHSVALEGALWRTLVALLLRPGRLTTEYFAGRRARYIAPLRLYLTASLILFAVSGLSGGDLKIGNESIAFRTPDEVEQSAVVIGPRMKEGMRTGVAFVDAAIDRVRALTPVQRSEHINRGVRQYLPYVLIVLVPVLALYLKLLYWNRRRLYGEHLVVAFHAQTVAFIFALLSAIPIGEIFGSVVLVLLVIHGAVALRRVYGGRRVPTIAREVVLLAAYGVTVGLALAGLATASLLFTT
jgi:Protein of unknown function (DUF3667)